MFAKVKLVCLAITVFCVAGFGCHRETKPPTPLPAESIPSEFQKAFAKAKPLAKDLSARVISALQTNDYTAAYVAVQELCAAPDATKAQKELSARALLTVTVLLQTAQSQGDEKAAEALNLHKIYK